MVQRAGQGLLEHLSHRHDLGLSACKETRSAPLKSYKECHDHVEKVHAVSWGSVGLCFTDHMTVWASTASDGVRISRPEVSSVCVKEEEAEEESEEDAGE